MNQAEYERLREAFAREYRKKLDALELIYAESQGVNGESKNAETKNGKPIEAASKDEPAAKGAVLEAVRSVLRKLPESFTWKDVDDQLQAKRPKPQYKDSSLRQAITRLVEIGVIKVAEQGKGRKATKYQRA